MKRKVLLIACCLTFAFLFTACTKRTSYDDAEEFKQYRNLTFTSAELHSTYDVRVYLPLAFRENENLPVIYIMEFTTAFHPDAQQFNKVIEITNRLGVNAIIVAGDKFDEDNSNFNNFAAFHATMTDDLVPIIDATFKNDTSFRTLMGRGSAAAHSLLMMLTESAERTSFQNYIVTDPPPNLGAILNSTITNDDFPQKKSEMRLHLSSSESVDWTQPISEAFENKNYPWLTFEYKDFPGIAFESNVGAAYTAGIEYIFQE